MFSPGKHIGREIAAAVGEVDRKLHFFVHGPMWYIYICTERHNPEGARKIIRIRLKKEIVVLENPPEIR